MSIFTQSLTSNLTSKPSTKTSLNPSSEPLSEPTPKSKNSLKQILFLAMLACLAPIPQKAQAQANHKPPHYRGLCTTPNNTIWISGTQSRILRGQYNAANELHFDTLATPYTNKDYRDIWAINDQIAVAMSVSDSAVVIKTTDGGKTWKTVYHNETPGIFLDAIEIDPSTGVGMILGDPLLQDQQSKKHFKALLTTDYGNTWINIPDAEWSIPLDTLESFYAASGTSLSIISSRSNPKTNSHSITVGFAGGGHSPQFHLVQIKYRPNNPEKPWIFNPLPNLSLHFKGGQAWGCYGLTTFQTSKGIAIGGNYTQPNFRGDSTGQIAAYTPNILKQWYPCKTPPHGYRSGICVSTSINKDSLFNAFFHHKNNQCDAFSSAYKMQPAQYFFEVNHQKNLSIAICTGTTGTDISFDEGRNWLPLSKEKGFNACAFDCQNLILAGNQGKIKTYTLKEIANAFQLLNPVIPSR